MMMKHGFHLDALEECWIVDLVLLVLRVATSTTIIGKKSDGFNTGSCAQPHHRSTSHEERLIVTFKTHSYFVRSLFLSSAFLRLRRSKF